MFLHGLGKERPWGEARLVSFVCDVVVGEPLRWSGERRRCLAELERELTAWPSHSDVRKGAEGRVIGQAA